MIPKTEVEVLNNGTYEATVKGVILMVEKRKVPICPECGRFVDGYQCEGDVVRYVGHNKPINSETGELWQDHLERNSDDPFHYLNREMVSCGKSGEPAEEGETLAFRMEDWGMEDEDPKRVENYQADLIYFTFNRSKFIRLENIIGRVPPDENLAFAVTFVKEGVLNAFFWGVHLNCSRISWRDLDDARVRITRLIRDVGRIGWVTTKDGRKIAVKLEYGV